MATRLKLSAKANAVDLLIAELSRNICSLKNGDYTIFYKPSKNYGRVIVLLDFKQDIHAQQVAKRVPHYADRAKVLSSCLIVETGE